MCHPRPRRLPSECLGLAMTADRRLDRPTPADRQQATAHDVRVESDALMLKVATGDHEAFDALYHRLAPGVFGLAQCVLGSRVSAEDVTRDVFAALWKRAPSFDASLGRAHTWAMTMTHRLSLDVARRRGSRNVTASTALAEAPRSDVVGNADVDLALGDATDQQRLAVAMAYYGGLTAEEVASALGVSAQTVTMQINDGLRRLGRTG